MKRLLTLILAVSLHAGYGQVSKVDSDNRQIYGAKLYYNGNIIPMETNEVSYADAVVEQDGKIAFTGNLAKAKKLFPNSVKIDLNGKTLVPGFIDPHSHFTLVSNTEGQINLNPPPVGHVSSITDLLDAIKSTKRRKLSKMANGYSVGVTTKVNS